MVKLTWKDKVRKVFGLGLTDVTAMAIAREEFDKKQKAIAAEKARLERAAAQKAELEKKLKESAEKSAPAKKPAASKVEKVKAAAKKTPSQPAPKKATASTTPKKATAKKPAPKKVSYKADAVDGDGDGLVQDGTIHERPAPKKKATPAKKKPSK